MKPTPFRLLFALLALPLAFGAAACSKNADEPTAVTSGAPIAPVAPPAGKQWSDVIAKTPEGGYRMGNPDAPLKLVEYGALSCSHCAEFGKEGFPTLRDKYIASGRVSLEIRFFMLNALDLPAVMLATCGPDEAVIPLAEQFWVWQPNMFDNLQKNEAQTKQIGQLPPAQQIGAYAQLTGMTDFFASRGIAREQGQACLADTAKAQALTDATEKASDADINSTPTFLLNGQNIGSMLWSELDNRLKAAGAR